MEKLILLSEDGVSQEFPLMGQRISIGRDEQNHICLGDKSVSRHHATVQRVYKGFTLQDEGSTNGTRVNGRLITKQYLKHRDLIEIGKYHLRFLESAPEDQAEEVDKTTVIRPTHQSALEPVPEKPQPVESLRPEFATQTLEERVADTDETLVEVAFEGEAAAKICYLAGEQKGQEVAVDRAFFSVGNPGGDLVLINRRHTGYFLLKVGGDAPPKINGTPIKAGGVELHHGDRIELGELSLEFRN
jgi:pSer/pThr/pTyr-binding forkhead associated (FHA) protein